MPTFLPHRCLPWLIASASLVLPASAATMIEISDLNGTLPPPNDRSFEVGTSKQQAEVMGWSQSIAYGDVRISAFLGDSRVGSTVTAYLTSAIGPGAGLPIATSTVSIAQTTGLPASTELFSGLTLEPGSYFLTLYNFDLSTATDPAWYRGASVAFGPGITANGEFYANNHGDGTVDPVNPWRSTFKTSPLYDSAFIVTGTVVPEPSAMAFLGLGLLGLLTSLWRRDSR
jgi:hypothetical protein